MRLKETKIVLLGMIHKELMVKPKHDVNGVALMGVVRYLTTHAR